MKSIALLLVALLALATATRVTSVEVSTLEECMALKLPAGLYRMKGVPKSADQLRSQDWDMVEMKTSSGTCRSVKCNAEVGLSTDSNPCDFETVTDSELLAQLAQIGLEEVFTVVKAKVPAK
ncbi:hypothetical protein HK405_016037, partial [Cladochytrium tenue]